MMDSSDTYIKMCDCPEIQQSQCAPDLSLERHNIKTRADYETWHPSPYWDFSGDMLTRPGDDIIWLPRQDQLQEMVREEYTFNLLADFRGFYNVRGCDLYPASLGSHVSMEQLWLAFVMKELHGKVWTGTEWKGDTDATTQR